MSLDPNDERLRQAVTERMQDRRADILRQAAHELGLEGLRRDPPGTWDDAVQHLHLLAQDGTR